MENRSILVDVRLASNVTENDDSFDGQLIPLTNTYLFRVAQIGIGKKGFYITGTDEQWTDFIEENFEYFHPVKTYVGTKVRLDFDPPENAALLTVLKEEVAQIEWCLYNEAEFGFPKE